MLLKISRKEKVGKNDNGDEKKAKDNTNNAIPFLMNNLVQAFTNERQSKKGRQNQNHI